MIKQIPDAKWSKPFGAWHIPYAKQFCWIVPNSPGNLDLINDYFKDRISELIIHDEFKVKTNTEEKRTIKANELLIIKTFSRRLKLIFGFNKELIDLMN